MTVGRIGMYLYLVAAAFGLIFHAIHPELRHWHVDVMLAFSLGFALCAAAFVPGVRKKQTPP